MFWLNKTLWLRDTHYLTERCKNNRAWSDILLGLAMPVYRQVLAGDMTYANRLGGQKKYHKIGRISPDTILFNVSMMPDHNLLNNDPLPEGFVIRFGQALFFIPTTPHSHLFAARYFIENYPEVKCKALFEIDVTHVNAFINADGLYVFDRRVHNSVEYLLVTHNITDLHILKATVIGIPNEVGYEAWIQDSEKETAVK